jgi:predicted amidohydrolase
MKVAAVNWEIAPIAQPREFFARLEDVISGIDADLIVLPELVVLELAGLHPVPEIELVKALSPYEPEFIETLQRLSDDQNMEIVGGSHLTSHGTNIGVVTRPFEPPTFHPKNVLTQWEAVEWGLNRQTGVPRCRNERLGVSICYDCEFPEGGRALANRGVLVQAIPAYTETVHGFGRVRTSALARAIENQIFVVHASLVGSLGREPVSRTHGSSAILAPLVLPFPADGILRESGDVRNFYDRFASDWSDLP